jgi:hypothetical protein
MFRILLRLFDPEKDPSKRREILNQQHGVTSQKRWSNTAVRTSPLGTLGVFVLERKNLADVRRFKLAKCRYYAGCVLRRKWGEGKNKHAPPARRWFILYRYTQKLLSSGSWRVSWGLVGVGSG